MKTAVQFQQVSKRFLLKRNRPRSLQELALSIPRWQKGRNHEKFWALRDVSFEIRAGETVGFIGPNGAGKSTVLKLVSRIIEPTSGTIDVHGRVGALLELGAGFHPDLTGRENIYLNGSILGLTRPEIQSRLDEIIAFAELDRFIDMPVKHYSSGMYVRLGFSVAVHTDPEVLLVDEVLAVGDEIFQRKCLDRVKRLKSQGVTILFVSHSLETVRELCQHAIWLEDGQVAGDGSVEQVIDGYLNAVSQEQEDALQQLKVKQQAQRWGDSQVEITDVQFLDEEGLERFLFHTGEPLTVRIQFHAHQPVERPVFGLAIYRNDGVHLSGPNTQLSNYPVERIAGKGSIDYRLESLNLLKGTYEVSAAVYDETCTHPYDHHERLYTFMVQRGEVGEQYGCVYMPSVWKLST